MQNTVINKPSRVTKNNVPASNDSNQASVSSESSQRGGLNNKKLAIGLLALVCLIALAYLLFDFKNKGVKKQNENSAVSANSSVTSPAGNAPAGGAQLQVTSATDPAIAELVQTVFKHIFLPSGNVQVATVVKADELRKTNPVFYQFAKEGDKVLIYADRAILYDPAAEKVLDVAHVTQPTK